ncbi:MBL fold metallo-hydrolase [Aureimonas mangrovi]|uniref:MBL fold metallo-hydrolase n=1 Tax=Aureimonas mangrovi TaxID=2758041 RepID=UPI00163DDA1A|nr:MBL fold metallo-hydrolase [Aureimonas mangrovi]
MTLALWSDRFLNAGAKGRPAGAGRCGTVMDSGGRLLGKVARIAFAGFALALLGACATPVCGPFEGRPAHHGIGGFCNEPGAPKPEAGPALAAIDGVRLATARYRGPVPLQYLADPAETLAELRRPAAQDRATWLGHATVLLEIDGKRVLVDPVWSTYVTPLPPFGPKRIVPPPVPIADLPPIDAILVTHDHYDHLDRASLDAMPGKDRIEVVVPLGVGARLASMGFSRIVETDWWQEREVAGLRLVTLPASHESGRTAFRKDDTLWASFALFGAGASGSRVYLTGDSGYHTHYARIGERFGPFDLAVMNLGGYAPLPVANAYHFTPEQSIAALRDLRAKIAVPVHWATYPLGSEDPFEPGPAFLQEAFRQGLDAGRARLMRIGETLRISAARGS